MTRGLDSLEVWQKSRRFAVHVCQEILPLIPQEERWSLVEQLRRSAQSIPANIAEGFGRYYYQESIRYCYIARGSLEETYSHLCVARDLGYIPKDRFEHFERELERLRRMLSGYIAFLKQSKRGIDEPGVGFSVREPVTPYPYDSSSNPELGLEGPY